MGHTTTTALEEILRGLAQGRQPEQLGEPLDRLVRVRAVQEFTPSQALSFIFSLRRVLRAEAGSKLPDDLDRFDAVVDALGLAAFEHYAKCREQLYTLRTDEHKRQTASLLMRAERSSVGSEQSDDSPS